MKCFLFPALALCAAAASLPAASRADPATPYRVVKTAKVGGAGGFDYVFADSVNRHLYIPRGNRVSVYDMDTLAAAGEVPKTNNVHGVAVDSVVDTGFSSSNPVVMWNAQTLETIKTIDVKGSPDAILFDPLTERVFVMSHQEPNVTVIDTKSGKILGTIDLGAAPEQAVTDEQGRVYIDLEDKDQVAVVDARSLKVTGRYGLDGKGGGPSGLAIDAQNQILFVCCRDPQTCVILSAGDGHVLATLPIGAGVDGAVFNPTTNEAFSSQRDGTLTVIKEDSPTSFEVEQTVPTMAGAKTCALDSKTDQLFLITAEFAPPPEPSSQPQSTGEAPPRKSRGPVVPDSFTILVVGK
jgi:DNA-binding beta-propeller fold protein YncE